MPFTPGMDFAGVVREVGSEVTDFAVGDRVFGATLITRGGSYAEYVTAPAAIVAHVPENIPLGIAAAVPLAALTAWEATFNAAQRDGRAGNRVLIQGGAGGTGTFAVQFAKQCGAYVIATSSAHNHDLLRKLGADEVVDYRGARFEDVVDPVDAVIDLVGGDVRCGRSPSFAKVACWSRSYHLRTPRLSARPSQVVMAFACLTLI
ncbi:MAG: NADPH:quinone reductase [Rhizobium sp.]|nr:NADPH:quinone reductase [Rhizobium sp.]